MDQVSPQAAIRRGMERQLRARREAESKGSKPIGWKLGFGTPASLKRFRLSGPLVGFLTDRTSLQDGATCQIAGLKNPRLEAEVAIVVGTRPERANSHVAMPLITALAPA